MVPSKFKKEGVMEGKKTLEKIIGITFAVDHNFSDVELLRIVSVLKGVLKKAETYKEELSYVGSLGYEQYVAIFGKQEFSIMFYKNVKEENGRYLQLESMKKTVRRDEEGTIEKVEKHYKPIVLQPNLIRLYKEKGAIKVELVVDDDKESYILGSQVDLRAIVEALPVAIKAILYKLSGKDGNLLEKLVINDQEKNSIRSFLRKKCYFKV